MQPSVWIEFLYFDDTVQNIAKEYISVDQWPAIVYCKQQFNKNQFFDIKCHRSALSTCCANLSKSRYCFVGQVIHSNSIAHYDAFSFSFISNFTIWLFPSDYWIAKAENRFPHSTIVGGISIILSRKEENKRPILMVKHIQNKLNENLLIPRIAIACSILVSFRTEYHFYTLGVLSLCYVSMKTVCKL